MGTTGQYSSIQGYSQARHLFAKSAEKTEKSTLQKL